MKEEPIKLTPKIRKMLKEVDRRNMEAVLLAGELDLGFCKLVKKEIRGGRGKSHGTSFKIGKFYKLGVKMSKEFKALLNK